MNCKVHVPENAEEKIASWGLPEELVIEIYSRFVNELQKRPLEVLRQVQAPVRMYQYSFSALHQETKYTFVFAIQPQDDGENLVVADCFKIGFVKRLSGKRLPVTTTTTPNPAS